jgi:hypothetical protein
MDPQAEKTPGLALPQPSSEQGGFAVPERAAAPETAPAPVAAPLTAPPITPAHPASQPPAIPAAAVSAATAAASVPSDDNTSDLDEEWINKAKAIVEQTKYDPRLESTEISKVKADFLRIRYNKQIKVADESK